MPKALNLIDTLARSCINMQKDSGKKFKEIKMKDLRSFFDGDSQTEGIMGRVSLKDYMPSEMIARSSKGV